MLKKIIPKSIRARIPKPIKQFVWYIFPPKIRAIRIRLWWWAMGRMFYSTNLKLEKIGSDYGGWFVPVDLIESDWICYCAGVGEDITFDLGLIERYSCHVFAFDPTPRAILYVNKVTEGNSYYHFYPYGLWFSDVQMKFYAPSNPHHVSHSILNLRSSRDYFIAECKRLKSIMNELNHTHIDLLKIDIEGAEYGVIDSIIEDNLEIKVINIEFDQPDSIYNLNGIRTFIKPIVAIFKLRRKHYRLVHFDRLNFTLVHENYL